VLTVQTCDYCGILSYCYSVHWQQLGRELTGTLNCYICHSLVHVCTVTGESVCICNCFSTAVHNITGGPRPLSVRLIKMTVQFTTWSAICPSVFSESTFANCSGRMKRAATSSTTEDALEPKKRKATYSTYEKWRHDFDRECKTVTRLGCETEMAGGSYGLSA